MISAYLEHTPLWAQLLINIVVLAVSVEAGFRYGLRRSRQPDFDDDDESHINSTTGAQLAMMAFILAFTFSLAADNFSERRQLRLEQVVVLQAAFLRAGYLEPEQRSQMRGALNEYIKLAARNYQPDELPPALEQARQLLLQMWQFTTELSREGKFGEEGALIAESINQLIEVHERRINAGLHKRIPASIWVMLTVLVVLSMFAMGYFAGLKQKRSLTTTSAMAVSLALIIWLISDLDRPQSGFLVTDTSRLQQLGENIDKVAQKLGEAQ